MELFTERGFEATTAAEIAAQAGLTERTFFRHFTDKREVLFAGGPRLQELIVAKLAATPVEVEPLDAVVLALGEGGAIFEGHRAYSRQRYALINKHPELMERELIKMATLAAALAAALRARGLPAASASLVAEAGIALFKVGYERWVEGDATADFKQELHAVRAELRSHLAAG